MGKKIAIHIFFLLTAYNILNFIFSNKGLFTEKFDPIIHKKLYGQSQYILSEPLSIIPDEIVYALSGWEYVHGLNPILLNGEQPPLGKYLIGLSELWFENSRFTGPIFNVLILVILYFLILQILDSKILASFLVYIFSFEKVFFAQMRYSPNLDNIQVFFILASFYFLVKYFKKNRIDLIFWSFIFLGLVISTKFWITGSVILLSYFLSFLLTKRYKKLKTAFLFAPIILVPLFISYTNSFLNGMDLREFFGTQKYIYAWFSSNINFDIIKIWNFLMVNSSHSADWQVTWPILSIVSFLSLIKMRKNEPVYIIGVWVVIYFALLVVGNINGRYFFPILPFLYILSGWEVKNLLKKYKL